MRRALPCVGALLGAALAVGPALAVQPATASNEPLDGFPPAPLTREVESVSPDGIEVSGWNAGAVHVPSDPTAWGGERPSFGGVGQPLSQRVASYELQATLDPDKHTIDGKEHLRWLNRSELPVRSLYFHLYLNAFESAGSTFMSEKVRYGAFRTDVETKAGEWGWISLASVAQGGKTAPWRYVHPDGGPDDDHTVVRVDLPDAVAPGAMGDIDVEFHDQLPRVVARTGYFDKYHLVAQWFPKVGVLELPGERGAAAPRWNCHEFHLNSEFYADFGNYRAELTAPKGYLVRATGAEQGAPRDGSNGLTTHTFAQDDVHDFVWTAWNGYAEPLRGAHDGPGSPHVEVEVLAPNDYEESGRVALQSTLDALRYFSETLGPYPYTHLTVVVPPFNARESGGMEYETFFTTDAFTGSLREFTRYITVHEFGHGYFMGLLASNEFEEPFLDEGMNEFWDARMMAGETIRFHLPGALEALGVTLPAFSCADFERFRGTSRFQADPIAGSSWDRFSSGSYALVYARTVMVFDDLQSRLGADALGRGMKLYYRRWHHRHPSTADLREALAEGSGQPEVVRAWFDQEVYRNEPIDDRIVSIEASEVLPSAGSSVVDGKRVENGEDDVERAVDDARKKWGSEHPGVARGGPFPFRSVVTVRRFEGHVPERLVVSFEDGSAEALTFPAEERWHRYVFERPTRVASAQLDPDRSVLLDLDKFDDGRTREAHAAASTRWALEAAHAVELVLSLLVTQ